MNVAQAIVKSLADRGVTQAFLVPGGHSMLLVDALASEPRIKLTPTHHECAAAMAADGYARVAGKPAVVCVSAGPAALNALNGVWGAYVDSVPMVVLSGAPRTETLDDGFADEVLRQLGDQEYGVTGQACGVAKRVAMLREQQYTDFEVEATWQKATNDRQGPAWLEVPIDVQAKAYGEQTGCKYFTTQRLFAKIKDACQQVLDRLRRAERPVILVGSGVRMAGALPQLRELVRRLGVPVVTAWAVDAFPTDDPHFAGRQGTIGDVGGNRAVQAADFLLVIGSRLGIRQVGYNWGDFAPKAFKAWVDVDPAELAKPTVKPDLPVCCDARAFLDEMISQDEGDKRFYFAGVTWPTKSRINWLAYCRKQWLDNQVVKPRHREWRGKVNPYHFCEVLWSKLADDDVVVCGDASATIMMMQTAVIKGERRLLSNSGAASMGWCLPAAIGACLARPGEWQFRNPPRPKRVICVTGDGSIMQNVQELATIAHNRLPVKAFMLCNGGYASIRWSQQAHLGREVAAGPKSGLGLPEFDKLAEAFGIGLETLDGPGWENRSAWDFIFGTSFPVLTEVTVDPDQQFEPRLRSRRLPDGSMVTAGWEEFG